MQFFLKRFILISIESNNRIKKKKDYWKDGWSSEISKKNFAYPVKIPIPRYTYIYSPTRRERGEKKNIKETNFNQPIHRNNPRPPYARCRTTKQQKPSINIRASPLSLPFLLHTNPPSVRLCSKRDRLSDARGRVASRGERGRWR